MNSAVAPESIMTMGWAEISEERSEDLNSRWDSGFRRTRMGSMSSFQSLATTGLSIRSCDGGEATGMEVEDMRGSSRSSESS